MSVTAWSPGGQVLAVLQQTLEAITFPSGGASGAEDRLGYWSGDPNSIPDQDRLFSLTIKAAPSRYGVDASGCLEMGMVVQLQVQYVFSPAESGAGSSWDARMAGDQELIEDALLTLFGATLAPQPGNITDVSVKDAPTPVLYAGNVAVVVRDVSLAYSRV